MKILMAAMAAAAVALLPVAADAHGPTRKKVTETVDINAPADKVWAAIGNFQDMSWHPAVEKNEGQGGNAVDATRKLTLKGGGTIEEVLYKFEPEQKSYSYRIQQVDVKVLPVTNYSSTITVIPVDATHSKVEWRGAFYRGYPNNDPPPELSDEAAIAAVTGVYRGGLDALKAKLEKGS
ncbi:SRPBCC family protein [Xanthobacter autotrophicus DSM 431]|uniref:SRPBCC family protein n=1 Tax=Xanthobacter nonsaccharivorans TaxID=3119912 RepID=UPI0037272D7D